MDIEEEYMGLRDRVIENFFTGLNDEQRSAVLSYKEKVLVAACPGAGKTQVIINRIIYLNTFGLTYGSGRVPENLTWEDIGEIREYMERGGLCGKRVPEVLTQESVHRSNIVVLTFTKMAAKGMKDRYMKVSGKDDSPFFGTFHSLFYHILEKHCGRIRIISEADAARIVGEVLSDYTDSVTDDKIRGVLNEISQHKNRKLLNITFEPVTDREVFRDCLSRYEEIKETRGFMDFDDILIKCLQLFEADGEILRHYRGQFGNILVDEFQDCDSQQIHILKLLGSGNRIFAVGDEDQCIYGFRGSRPDCMVDFCSHFENGIKYFLNRNYRSRSNIIDSAKNLISFNLCRNEKKMRAVREEQGIISLIPCSGEMDQAEKVAEIICGMEGQHKLHETAVLYRTNREYGLLTGTLLKHKIEFNMLGTRYNFLEDSLCSDMLAYFRLSMDASDRPSFLRIVNRPNRYISKTKIEKIKNCPVARNSFSLMAEQKGMSLDQIKSILRLEKQIRRMKRRSPSAAIDYVLRKIGYDEYLLKNETGAQALGELMELAGGFASIKEFLKFADEYSREMERSGQRGKGVVLSTIHGVKGLEYKNVIIVNCRDGNMPHSNSQSNIEEERRIFYVGVTRAADNLWLLWPEECRGGSCTRSPFVDEFFIKV
jgi:DNA helicase II / ATP-dependent DNA helicase PcrA